MLKNLVKLISEAFRLFSSVFGESKESDDVSDEIKLLVKLVSEKDYINASVHMIESVKSAKDLEIDEIAFYASKVNLDLHELYNVILVITESKAQGDELDVDEKKSVSILENVLTYAS